MVLASPAKVGREAWVQIFDWSQVDELVASSLPVEFREGLSQYGTHVTVST
jgi:DeoR/GlpR family transcriptional regulator of sugar metabolism